jgi:hypothetical protein
MNISVVRPPDIETHSLLPSSLYFHVADPISSIHSERFLRFFARTHDGELSSPDQIIVKFMQHKRLMMRAKIHGGSRAI